MGYRSEVALAMKKEVYHKNESKLREAMKDCDTLKDIGDSYVFIWESVKWYEGYDDIQAIENVLHQCEDKDYGFIRVGEEDGDIERKGDFYDFDLYTTTTIESPSGEEIETKNFFALNSVKFMTEET